MSELSREELASITFKADFVSKTLLNELYKRGVTGEALRRTVEECLPDMPDIVRQVEAGLSNRDELPGVSRDADGNPMPSSLADVHPDIDPDLVQWAFEQVALLMVRERLGPDPDEEG